MPYLIVFLLVIFYFWVSDDSGNPSQTADSTEQSNISPSQETIQSTLQRLESENESVMQARYNEGGAYNWVVIVNGATSPGSWKGYARALCNTLYEANILNEENKDSTIEHRLRVVDATRFIDTNGHFRDSSLGSSDCKTFAMYDT